MTPPPADELRSVVSCEGHQELRDIVIELRADVRNSTRNMESFMARIEHCIKTHDEKITKIEVERLQPAEIKDINERLTTVEAHVSTQKGEEKNAGKVAAVVAFVTSLVMGIIGVAISLNR
jgi:RNase H-fold protein (predicted Holliday junction resolvase)